MAVVHEYEWIFIVATFVAICVAWGIGANDVANSFGSSVGSRALTMGQAIIIASLCEFLGAVLLGASVAGTIKSGVAQLSAFTDTPELFMIGMLAVLIAVAFWLALATFLELPVSTSHSVVGAVVGMTIAIRNGQNVLWYRHLPGQFPYIAGMTVIFLSWIVSPLLAAIATSILYLGVRHLVLRRKRSFDLACVAIVFLIGLTVFVIVTFILQTGSKNDQWKAFSDGKNVWIGLVAGAGAALLAACTFIPWIRWQVRGRLAKIEQLKLEQIEAGTKPVEAEDSADIVRQILDVPMPGRVTRAWNACCTRYEASKFPGKAMLGKVVNVITYSARQEPHKSIGEDPFLKAMHESAERFDPATEALFRYLQVFTAAVFSLAHGSNDVANSVGPYAAIYAIYKSGKLSKSAEVPVWILAMGGAGIVLGVATYGYKIIRVFGVKMVHLSYTRGFAVELGAAIVVVTASRYGLPVSSTQTLMGSIIAIGLAEKKFSKSLNLKLLFKIVMGWVATLVVAGLTAGIITAVLVYSPSKLASDDRVYANRALNRETLAMLNQLRAAASPLVSATALQGYNRTLTTLFQPGIVDLRNVTNLNTQVFSVYDQVF